MFIGINDSQTKNVYKIFYWKISLMRRNDRRFEERLILSAAATTDLDGSYNRPLFSIHTQVRWKKKKGRTHINKYILRQYDSTSAMHPRHSDIRGMPLVPMHLQNRFRSAFSDAVRPGPPPRSLRRKPTTAIRFRSGRHFTFWGFGDQSSAPPSKIFRLR